MNKKIDEMYSKYSKMSNEELVNALNEANPEAKLRYDSLLKKEQELKSRNETNKTIDDLYEKAKADKNASDYNFLENYIKNRGQIDNIVKLMNAYKKKSENFEKEEKQLEDREKTLKEQCEQLGKENIVKVVEEVNNLENKLKEKEEQLKNLEKSLSSIQLNDVDVYQAAKKSLENEIKNIKEMIDEKKQSKYYLASVELEKVPSLKNKIETLKINKEHSNIVEKRLEVIWKSMTKGIPMESIKFNDGKKKYKLSSIEQDRINRMVENEEKAKQEKAEDLNEKNNAPVEEENVHAMPSFLKKNSEKSVEDKEEKELEDVLKNDVNKVLNSSYPAENAKQDEKVNAEKNINEMTNKAEEIKNEEKSIATIEKKNIFSRIFSKVKAWFKNLKYDVKELDKSFTKDVEELMYGDVDEDEEEEDLNDEKMESVVKDDHTTKSQDFRDKLKVRRNEQVAFIKQVDKMTKTTSKENQKNDHEIDK